MRPRGRAGDPESASGRNSSTVDGREPGALDHRLETLLEAARAGAGLVVTAAIPLGAIAAANPRFPELLDDAQLDAWRAVVDEVHAAGALIVARLAVSQAAPNALAGAVTGAATAGFDMLLLDPGSDLGETEKLPAAVAAARELWRSDGWIAAVIYDRPAARAAVLGYAAQAVRAGAKLLWASAPDGASRTQGARLPAAPLADRLRNELGVATAIECGDVPLPDLEAAIAAGRADLVIVGRLPDGARRAS